MWGGWSLVREGPEEGSHVRFLKSWRNGPMAEWIDATAEKASRNRMAVTREVTSVGERSTPLPVEPSSPRLAVAETR